LTEIKAKNSQSKNSKKVAREVLDIFISYPNIQKYLKKLEN